MQTERRRAERIPTGSIAYIHLAPDNGGIVLNLSSEGLAFHSAGPVRHDGSVRFWISLRANERIEGTGELAWTDASGKTGGLKLTQLSEGAREQISAWIRQPPDGAESPATAPLQLLNVRDRLPMCGTGIETGTPEVHAAASLVSDVVPLAFEDKVIAERKTPVQASVPATGAVAKKSASLPAVHPKPIPAVRATPHSGKAIPVIGALILCGAIGVGIRYRSNLGSFLIYLGNHLAHTSKSGTNQTAPSWSAPAVAHTPAQQLPALSAAEQDELTQEIVAFDRENRDEEASQAHVSQAHAPTHRPKPPPEESPSAAGTTRQIAKPRFSAGSPSADSVFVGNEVPANNSDEISSSAAHGNAARNGNPPSPRTQEDRAGPVSANEVEDQLANEREQGPIYLDVGNSKDVSWADETAGALLNMGFNVVVHHKGHLWMSSYHVLVGPYVSDRNLDKASEALRAHGFNTRYAKR